MARGYPKTANAPRVEGITDQLRTAIQTAYYLPGERLTELTLSKKLNVSQNTIRDALSTLENEGWVVKRPRRGVFVRTFTDAEAAEVLLLWGAVEAIALRQLVQTFTKSDAKRLRGMLKEARRLAHSSDERGAAEMLFQFHEMLGDLSGLTQTAELLRRLCNQGRLLETMRRMRNPRSLEEQDAQISTCEAMVDALEAGDAALSLSALQQLVRETPPD